MSHCLLLVFICLSVIQAVLSANILFFLTSVSQSHNHIHWPIATELVNKGHNVTFHSSVPKNGEHHPNISEVYPPAVVKHQAGLLNDNAGWTQTTAFDKLFFQKHYGDHTLEMCRLALMSEGNLLQQRPKFDLVIIDDYGTDCGVVMAYAHDAPFIFLSTPGHLAAIGYRTGNPNVLSMYTPSEIHLPMPMDLWTRLANILVHSYLYVWRYYDFFPKMQVIAEEALGRKIPAIQLLEREVAFTFVNQHFSTDHHRPLLSNIAEIGGIHIKPVKPLPKDLQNFLDGSGEAGFIYFSFGTFLNDKQIPMATVKAIAETFAQLPQRVVWRWRGDVANVSSNVLIRKSFPQNDILDHPHARLIITHGGLLSHHEAVYHGIPLLTVPFFYDQDNNAQNAELHGYGLTLRLPDITVETLLPTVRRLLEEPQFRHAAKRVSNIFRDQPETPLERAVYWTEYVLRHKGADHLKSPARHVPIYQYYSLDVLAIIISIVGISVYIFYHVVRFLPSLFVISSKHKDD